MAQLGPTLYNPMDSSLPGSSTHGIFQARVLEWAAISFSRGSSQPRDRIQVSHIADRPFITWATRESYYDGFSSVQSLSCIRLFATPWIAAHQASLSITNSRSSLRFTSIESVMSSSHLLLCRPLLLLPPIPPSIRVFSNESTLRMRWPQAIGRLIFLFLKCLRLKIFNSVGPIGWMEKINYRLIVLFISIQKSHSIGENQRKYENLLWKL